MAIGTVKLTKKQRYLFAIVLAVLNSVQIVLGLVIIFVSIHMCVSVSSVVYSERAEIKFVFTVLGLYGTHVIFQNAIGFKICQKCYRQAHKKSTKKLLFLWTLAGCNTMINMLILAAMAVKISKHIIRSLRHSLEKGMSTYLHDHYWKYTIDKLQVTHKCCGVTSYTNWYELTWLDEYHINVTHPLVQKLRTSSTGLHLPVVPWSCCRTDFPMQCFHDPFQQISSANIWKEQPSTVIDSIYDRGCLTMVRGPIETALSSFIVIVMILLILQIASILVARILYTSCRNAIILDDPEGIAPGWIFGRGDCGWTRGPTLLEIMGITPGSKDRSSSRTGRKSRSSGGRGSLGLHKTRFLRPTNKNDFSGERASLIMASSPRSINEPVSSGEEEALMLNR